MIEAYVVRIDIKGNTQVYIVAANGEERVKEILTETVLIHTMTEEEANLTLSYAAITHIGRDNEGIKFII